MQFCSKAFYSSTYYIHSWVYMSQLHKIDFSTIHFFSYSSIKCQICQPENDNFCHYYPHKMSHLRANYSLVTPCHYNIFLSRLLPHNEWHSGKCNTKSVNYEFSIEIGIIGNIICLRLSWGILISSIHLVIVEYLLLILSIFTTSQQKSKQISMDYSLSFIR